MLMFRLFIPLSTIYCLLPTLIGCGSSPPAETPRYKGDLISREAHLDYRNGKFKESLSKYREAYNHYSKIDGQVEMARISNNICVVSYQLGKNSEALEAINESIRLYTLLRDELAYSRCLINRASVLLELGKLPEAQKDFNEALGLLNERSGPVDRARIFMGQSFIAINNKDLDEAEKLSDEAMILYEKSKDSGGMASVFLAKAKIFRQKGDLEKAEAHALKALELDKVNEISIAILKDLVELGVITESRDKSASREYYNRALTVAKALNLQQAVQELDAKIKVLR